VLDSKYPVGSSEWEMYRVWLRGWRDLLFVHSVHFVVNQHSILVGTLMHSYTPFTFLHFCHQLCYILLRTLLPPHHIMSPSILPFKIQIHIQPITKKAQLLSRTIHPPTPHSLPFPRVILSIRLYVCTSILSFPRKIDS